MEFFSIHALVLFVVTIAGIAVASYMAFLYRSFSGVKKAWIKLSETHTFLSPYWTFEAYLINGDREKEITGLKKSMNFLDSFIHSPFHRKNGKLIANEQLRSSLETLDFLENYPRSYIRAQIIKNKEFLNRIVLDRSQTEAVLKMDRYNLVLAPAGSGKTRCLTSRIAFVIESGIPSSRVLAVSYTRDASEEMHRRLKDKFNMDIEVRTLHSFSRKLAADSPRYRSDVAADRQSEFVWDALMSVILDPEYSSILSSFLSTARTGDLNAHFIDSKPPNGGYTTIHGLSVKSRAEQAISNFLLLNGIKFRYEEPANWADQDSHHRKYHPDFYLYDYDVYIEHWAVDRNGNVPEWFSESRAGDPSQMYREKMEWKKAQFRRHGKILIETYEFENMDGSLISSLTTKLREAGIEMHEIPISNLQKYISKASPILDPFDEQMNLFISNAKLSGVTREGVRKKLKLGNWTYIQRSFASLMIPIWEKYEARLEKEGMIDFTDMALYALDSLSMGKIPKNQYSHIMVDEFQDTNDPQLLVMKKLSELNPQAKLFCVGDDMQNIFSFAGSNVRNITHFNDFFPSAETTILEVNYRCPKNIVDASTVIMKYNPSAIQKDVKSDSVSEYPITLIEYSVDDDTYGNYDEWERVQAKNILDYVLRTKNPDEEVMVLSRHNFRLKGFSKFGDKKVKFSTIHKAKGTEADYVILLGCVGGSNGFPSNREDMGIFDIVKNKKYNSKEEKRKEFLQEERRLFYVAVTRCKKQLYILSDQSNTSPFLEEIGDYLVSQPIG